MNKPSPASGAINKIGQLLWGRDGTGSTADGAVGTAAETLSNEVFEALLETVFAERDVLSVGGLHLIGLQRIRDRLGGEWEDSYDKVIAIAERVIRRSLLPTDAFTLCHDTTFVLTFPTLNKAQAQIKCAVIGREIYGIVLGEGMRDLADVRTAALDVDGQILVEEAKPLEVVTKMLQEASIEWVDLRAHAAVTRLSDAGTVDVAADPLDGIDFGYQPIWNVRGNVLSAYLCLPLRQRPGASPLSGHAVLSAQADIPEIAYLDCAVLHHASEQLQALHRSGRKAVLSMPVHIQTFALTTTRSAFFAKCGNLAPEFRNFLVMELVGVSDAVPATRLYEAVGTLRTAARSVVVQTDINQRNLAPLRDAGVHAIGVDLRKVPGSGARKLKYMERFAEKAAKLGVRSFLNSVDTLSLATAAVSSGFHYLAGDAIAPMVAAPDRLRRFTAEDLVARRFST